jgi:hypothetical protein
LSPPVTSLAAALTAALVAEPASRPAGRQQPCDVPRIGRFRPYLAAGAGLEEYATALKLPDGALAAQRRTAFAINAGGGLKVAVDDKRFPPAGADDHRVEMVGDGQTRVPSSLPADPIETSARPDRIMYQKRMTPGIAIKVVSR